MDFHDSPEEAAFRAEARAWLQANAPKYAWHGGPGYNPESIKIARDWQALKAEAGYTAFTWPEGFGGAGGGPVRQVIFEDEQRAFPLPINMAFMSVDVVLPALFIHATPEQYQPLIGPALRGETFWCELFSEPSGGSDVSGFRTRAERDGDDYILNGQKCWNSYADWGDWGVIVARTDPTVPKHKGLSLFMLDLRSPGVEVRPIRQLNGFSEYNEVFLTDVRVPAARRVGREGDGWKIFLTIIGMERLGLSFDPQVARNTVGPLTDLARATPGIAASARLQEHDVRQGIADYYVNVRGIEHLRSRLLTALSRGQTPGAEAGVGKLVLASALQEMAAVGMDIAGPAGALSGPDAGAAMAEIQESYFLATGYRLGGGTDEILRNTIGERVLGLPADVRTDKDTPFNQL